MERSELKLEDNFFIVARESGQQRADLPTWADLHGDNVDFESPMTAVPTRRDVDGVPGAFQILNLLSDKECAQFVATSEALGYHLDAPVSLPHEIRHNTNINWIVHENIETTIWNRFASLLPENVRGQPALGLNARFRFYRYAGGDYFKPHTDGAWPGSKVIDGKLIPDAYGDRLSQMTCLIFLSDGYVGGRTLFYVNPRTHGPATHTSEVDTVAISTPKGAALCFPHGFHPEHCLHAGESVTAGVKYIIRTDILFGMPDAPGLTRH